MPLRMSLSKNNAVNSQHIDENSRCKECDADLELSSAASFPQILDEKIIADPTDIVAEFAKSTYDFQSSMCTVCHELLVRNMEEQVSFEREQNACRKKYLENLVQSRAKVEQDEGNGRKILAGLKERESILFKELQALNDEEAMILRETGVFNKMHQKNEEECIRVFNNLRNLHSDSSIFTVENTKRNGMISSTRDALDVLSTNRNMFPRLFYINFDENNIGSINGLKLARFSGEKKSNAESNAAWGQCIHCLERLFALNDINMAPYYLDLAGAYSTISYTNEAGVVDEMKMYEGISVDFKITDFDKAILHFFNCLRKFETEFCNKVEVPNNRLFPNTIYKDSIAEGFVSDVNDKCVDWYSGKISFNNDKRWAKAMRLMLMNLKVGVLETGI